MKVAISLKENELVLNNLLHTLEIKGFKIIIHYFFIFIFYMI